ncbi:MAG TPA: trypsin-like peptidase domain-containing protein [Solirubrobacteraceae bacterium]|nr:trypsin-like peptidase domain-containing protein [Solirubrobacteraceae bacterium]
MRSTVRSFSAALLGGALVAVALLVVGVGGGGNTTTTIVQQAPLTAASGGSASSSGLTPREIYKRAAPGVVFVRAAVSQQTQSPFDLGPLSQQGEATGSGFVIDKNGTILTNAHVIDGAQKVTVQFEDQSIVDAKVIGKDLNSDLALLTVAPDGLTLDPLPLGDSKNVQVGDPTIAIGNPFGLDRTLTTGVVSALQRQIKAPNGFQIDNVIQTDAPINPGNSGGPLIDATGKVIGVNSQIETGGGSGSVGIGFAVPIDTAKQVIPQLEHGGTIQRAYLGLTSLTIDGTLGALGLPVKAGALVESINSGSPAEKAGIRAGTVSSQINGGPIQLGGDIIVAVDGKPVTAANDLGTLISAHKPGESVTIELIRGTKHQTVTVKLGTRPNTVATTGG